MINNKVEYDTSKIIHEFYTVYNNLLGESKINIEKIENYEFKTKSYMNEEEKIKLNKPFTFDELNKVIGKMKSSSPGLNGLTIGFYKRYFVLFGDEYVKLVNDGRRLPN